mmetsp:Transcript_7658/g.11135  ORF Transcript_7658/g.11135 Transcript_7658/m.11135 type:complete len:494 (+) Transcript_7658:50-1531(+)
MNLSKWNSSPLVASSSSCEHNDDQAINKKIKLAFTMEVVSSDTNINDEGLAFTRSISLMTPSRLRIRQLFIVVLLVLVSAVGYQLAVIGSSSIELVPLPPSNPNNDEDVHMRYKYENKYKWKSQMQDQQDDMIGDEIMTPSAHDDNAKSEQRESLELNQFQDDGTNERWQDHDQQENVFIDSRSLDGYKDAWELLEDTDLPVFWHIPKAGGSMIKDILGACHRFCMATSSGIDDGHGEDTEIARVKIPRRPGQDPTPFVNVDTTTIEGLQRAKKLGLAQSGLADAMVTQYYYDANDLFDFNHKGRLFTLFRHPIERSVSMFTYLQYADWEPTYNPDLAKMTIEEFAQSPFVENNWITRRLTNTLNGPINKKHVEVAMDLVRRKFIVGLLDRLEESMERFEKFFGWKYTIMPTNQEICRENLLKSGANSNRKKMTKLEPDSEAYRLLASQNEYDIRLYKYIERLFDEQENFVRLITDGYRLEDATCCKCSKNPC